MATNKSLSDVPEYEFIDFDGYVMWARKDDGRYAVDPLYLEKFKTIMGIEDSKSSLVAIRRWVLRLWTNFRFQKAA